MNGEAKQALTRPLLDENPITLQILGICSALAVTVTLKPSLYMCLALTAVLACSMAAISAIRAFLPGNVRIIVQMTIIAALVIVADELLKTWAYETSRQLSVFVGLIITNCIVLGRAEAYASKHPPGLAFLDGLGNGLGYSLVLVAVAATRELLAGGTLLGVTVLPASTRGGWYPVNGFLRQPPSAFFLIGLLVWAARSWRPAQAEQPEYPPAAEAEAARA
jgi:Na+-transporting NADH:ubiquinone oxidoreductase subunit D